MADHEQILLLERGAIAWNTWREQNPSVRPDLSGADLRKANLNWYDLRHADLQGGDLSDEGFLGNANLRWAVLDHADLSRANLRLADLTGATLSKANLTEASLRGATLSWCDLSDATLRDTDLEEANLAWADFSRADLQAIKLSTSFVHGTIGLEGVAGRRDVPFPFFTRIRKDAYVPKGAASSDTPTAEQQFELLREGVAAWNAWRAQKDSIWINLRGIDLSGLNLEEANLTGADLSGTN
jgi:uncharacterized protein YjbI with pentapeptide repeats